MDQNATRRTSSETVGEDMTLSLFRVPNSWHITSTTLPRTAVWRRDFDYYRPGTCFTQSTNFRNLITMMTGLATHNITRCRYTYRSF
jgi:TFIIF-interacting CTD phosphatase-like protein